MEANTPEKIYIGLRPSMSEGYVYTTVDKDFLNAVEYVRTDSFIEKAVEYILTHIPDMYILGCSCRMDECIIEDFKKYMKGE